MKSGFFAPVLALAVVLLVGGSARSVRSQAAGYTVSDLGTIPGASYSYPQAIDTSDPSDLKVAGHTNVVSKRTSYGRAYYWSSRTGMVDVGVLPGLTSGTFIGMNCRGEIIGRSTGLRVFYWNPSRGAGSPLELASLGGGATVNAINDAGIIVGGSWLPGTAPETHENLPVYWKPSTFGVYGEPIILPGLRNPDGSPNGMSNYAGSINAAGDIAGSCRDAAGVQRAVIWRNAGTPQAPAYGDPDEPSLEGGASSANRIISTDPPQAIIGRSNPRSLFRWTWGGAEFPQLQDLGHSTYLPEALNVLGQAAGYAADGATGKFRAVLWQPDGSIRDLGTLGGSSSRARGLNFEPGSALNDAGQVVGYSYTGGDQQIHGFLWTEEAGMRDLNDTALTPNKATFAYLEDAVCISGEGYITGRAYRAGKGGKVGQSHTYLLSPK